MSYGVDSYGVDSYGVSSFGIPPGTVVPSGNATAQGGTGTSAGSGSGGDATGITAGDITAPGGTGTSTGSGSGGTASGGTTYDVRIAIIGDSNASGRGSANQTPPASGAYLYDNSGTIVALADPWDGGTQTYSALDDSALASGSIAPRLAVDYSNAGKTTLLIPANKGGTAALNWARSVATTTCYGAMKARIDAAGGVDKIIILLGANDAMNGVSQATFATRINQLIADLRSDYPSAEIYFPKVHTITTYAAQCAVIRAGVDDVWGGTSGVKPGGDLDGVTTAVHYTSNAELSAVADRIFNAIAGTIATGGIGTSTGSGTGGTATGVTAGNASGGTGTSTGSGSGGTATGTTAGSATADGGIGTSTGSGSGGAASGEGTFTGSLSDADIARIAAAVLAALQATAIPVNVKQVNDVPTPLPWPTATETANEVLNGVSY